MKTITIAVIVAIVIVIVGAGAYLLLSQSQQEVALKTAKIGVLIDITGLTSFHGRPGLNGIQLALEKINELYPNGVPVGNDRYKFELVIGDFAGKTEDVPTTLKQLLDQGVYIIISQPGTDLIPALPDAEAAKVPILVWLDPSPGCPLENPWVYRYQYTIDSLIGGVVYYVMHERGADKMAILAMTLAATQGMSQVAKIHAERYGQLVYWADFDMSETVFHSYLANAMAAGANCIFSIDKMQVMSQYMQAYELGYDGYFASITGLNEDQTAQLGGADYGKYMTKVYQGEGYDPFTSPKKTTREWGMMYKQRFGEAPSDVVTWTYDLLLISVGAAMEAGTISDGNRINQALAEMPFDFELADHLVTSIYPTRGNKLWTEEGTVVMPSIVAGWTREGCKIPIVEVFEENGVIVSLKPVPESLQNELIEEFHQRHS